MKGLNVGLGLILIAVVLLVATGIIPMPFSLYTPTKTLSVSWIDDHLEASFKDSYKSTISRVMTGGPVENQTAKEIRFSLTSTSSQQNKLLSSVPMIKYEFGFDPLVGTDSDADAKDACYSDEDFAVIKAKYPGVRGVRCDWLETDTIASNGEIYSYTYMKEWAKGKSYEFTECVKCQRRCEEINFDVGEVECYTIRGTVGDDRTIIFTTSDVIASNPKFEQIITSSAVFGWQGVDGSSAMKLSIPVPVEMPIGEVDPVPTPPAVGEEFNETEPAPTPPISDIPGDIGSGDITDPGKEYGAAGFNVPVWAIIIVIILIALMIFWRK